MSGEKLTVLRSAFNEEDFFINGNWIILNDAKQQQLDVWMANQFDVRHYLKSYGFQKKDCERVLAALRAKRMVEDCWQSILLDHVYVNKSLKTQVHHEMQSIVKTEKIQHKIPQKELQNLGIPSSRLTKETVQEVLGKKGRYYENQTAMSEILREKEYVDLQILVDNLQNRLKFKIKKSYFANLATGLMNRGICVAYIDLPLVGKMGHYYALQNEVVEQEIVSWVRENWECLVPKESYIFMWNGVDSDFKRFIADHWKISIFDYCERHQPELHQILAVLGSEGRAVENLENGHISSLMRCLPKSYRKTFKYLLQLYATKHEAGVRYNTKNLSTELYDDKEEQDAERVATDYKQYKALGVAILTRFAEREGIIGRALKKSQCAQILLFMALHIAIAWRLDDICNIQLSTRIDLDRAKKYIEHKDFENPFFNSVWNIFSMELVGRRASKQNGELVEACPQMFRGRLGLYLCIAELFRNADGRETLIDKSIVYEEENYEELLTKEIYKAIFHEKGFRNSSIVKALLRKQAALTQQSMDSLGYKRLPFMVAAYLRGHKIDVEKKVKSIFYYIESATENYSPNEVLRETWCGDTVGHYKTAIASHLFSEYEKIDFKEQTQLLHDFGEVSPAEMEKRFEALRELAFVTKAFCIEMPKDKEGLESRLKQMIEAETIIAIGKEEHTQCLYSLLTGYRCVSKDGNEICSLHHKPFGCDFAIYHRSYIWNLANRRDYYLSEGIKYQNLLNTGTLSEDEEAIANNMIRKAQYCLVQIGEDIQCFISSFEDDPWAQQVMADIVNGEGEGSVFSQIC